MLQPLALALWLSFLLIDPVFAIDFASNSLLCERFLKNSDRHSCELSLKTKKPDTYFASICRDLFDDHLFYRCIDLASEFAPDPKLLEVCGVEALGDEERMKCLLKVAHQHLSSRYQGIRVPASRNSH